MNEVKRKSIIFLADIIVYEGQQPIEVVDGYYFKKADLPQVETIKEGINVLGRHAHFIERYELRPTELEDGRRSFQRLEDVDWNYWIIEHDKIQAESIFKIALSLLDKELYPLFEIVYFGDGFGAGKLFHPIEYGNYTAENLGKYDTVQIKESDILQIKNYYLLLKDFETMKDQYNYIFKGIEDFDKLKLISKRTPFKLVGLFSIIESLLVHNPQRGDNGITHQLKTKLNLLNNRFDQKLDFRKYFNGPHTLTFEKIIEMLYSYRSDIAHGDFTDFNNELQIIANYNSAYEFLYMLLKKLIIFSLREPQLINDLKYC